MGIFGWSYPPGCSGPPEYPDPAPQSEEVQGILEKAGVDDAVIEQVVKIMDALAEKAARDCPECERRALVAEASQYGPDVEPDPPDEYAGDPDYEL